MPDKGPVDPGEVIAQIAPLVMSHERLIILDIGGSRDARRRQLEQLVDAAVARLDEGASQASLPAMSSYERKLIHDIVADRGLVSESYGEGSDRHTVIRRA